MDTLIEKSRASIIATLFIVFLLLMISSSVTPLMLRFTGLIKVNGWVFFVNRLVIWAVLFLVWIYTSRVEKQGLLIWPESKRTLVFYILAVITVLVIVFIGNIIITSILNAITHNEVSRKFLEYLDILKGNTPLLIFTVFTAAVVEELIFRGFIQTRLSLAFNNHVLGIILSSLLFGIVHLSYGTLSQFIGAFFIGLVFSVFYWKYKNIKVLMLCHFLWDALGIIIAIKSH